MFDSPRALLNREFFSKRLIHGTPTVSGFGGCPAACSARRASDLTLPLYPAAAHLRENEPAPPLETWPRRLNVEGRGHVAPLACRLAVSPEGGDALGQYVRTAPGRFALDIAARQP